MNLNLKKGKWYRQGVELSNFFASVVYETALRLIGFDSAIAFTEKNNNLGLWHIETCRKIAEKKIERQIKDPKYVLKIIKTWKTQSKKIIKFEKQLNNLGKISNIELIKKLKQYADLKTNLWKISIIIEVFDPTSETICKKYLEKYKSKLSLEEFKILSSNTKLSLFQQEKLSLLKLFFPRYNLGKNTKNI